MLDRLKMGFGVPLDVWLGKELKDYLQRYLNKDRLIKEDIFNADMIISLKDRFLAGKKVSIHRIWFILIFEMWYEKWVA
ncbi:hypothetical protein FACS1894137_11960 [Spirochaetia bacterium]|nr:hypothetical protein FACS1894137_11960 [Spirochaetia bacterium]